MKIVIDIPEEMHKAIVDGMWCGNHTIGKAIANGIPLPKGHGRLIDANRLRSVYSITRANFNTIAGIQNWIDDARRTVRFLECKGICTMAR